MDAKEKEFDFQVEMEPCPVEATLKLISNKWKVLIFSSTGISPPHGSHIQVK